MRLKHIDIAGFRGFPADAKIDLDANAVVIVGANGVGKTSLFDAIHWAVTGTLDRLGVDNPHIVSLFSSSGQARVRLVLGEGADEIIVTRTTDGADEQLQIELDRKTYRGDAARVRLIETLWPEALATSDSSAAIAMAMTRGVYLQQDKVREFLDAVDDQDRFLALSELIGVGRITELQHSLEKARTAWSTATNERRSEQAANQQRLVALQAEHAALSDDADIDKTEREWAVWLQVVATIAKDSALTIAVPEGDQVRAVNAVVASLTATQRLIERRRDEVGKLASDLSHPLVSEEPTSAPPAVTIEAIQAQLQLARESLAATQASAAESREQFVRAQDQAQELAALAQIALRHLDSDNCPVCEQPIIPFAVRDRLNRLLTSSDNIPVPDVGSVDKAAAVVRRLEAEEAALQKQLLATDAAVRGRELYETDLKRRAAELGFVDGDLATLPEKLAQLEGEAHSMLARLNAARAEGVRLLASVGRIGESARRREVSDLLEKTTTASSALANELKARDATAAYVERILTAIRSAATDVVDAQLERLAPLVNRIYGRIDPHPAFRNAKLIRGERRNRGWVQAEVSDPASGQMSRTPQFHMSSSQTNALAVTIFLALNLGLPRLPLDAALLDDPLQSLDDVNLLG
ncbi:MAG: AAA family ATPase [Candidatus Dormibacteraeota bacterium]|uniref:Nuclease SbcCD subunit C n=1 Tax=Candidatus Aeolococcus gillhamiae TaxID=3127015 RepID=A0A934K1S9_9BACT|nr:AAA family ATPase [Candidatus Dormibacteraeota bacterium]